MPFLEVLTRCYKRPHMLARNMASLDCQTCDDWEQTLLIDEVGRGVAWANAQLANYEPTGDYVWILDDDDECVDEMWVETLLAIGKAHSPGVVWCKTHIEQHGVLPEVDYWQRKPEFGHVAMSGFAVSLAVYREFADAFDIERGADCNFAQAVYDNVPSEEQYWLDRLVMKTQRVSRGKPE